MLGVREYLSQYEPAVSVDPSLMVSEARRVRAEAGRPDARLALLDKAV